MAKKTSDKRKQQQRQATIQIIIVAGILVCLNILAARFHKGLDLTKEKRFTLSNATKRLLKNLDETVVVEVYLKGKFPAGFQRLSEATRERLQSFREYSGNHLVYRFVDPFEGLDEIDKGKMTEQLYKKGVEPMALNVKGKQNSSEQIIFPYALIRYKGKETAVKLLENRFGMMPLEVLNYSESLLEYKLATAIHQLEFPVKPTIGYIVGHGEAFGMHTYDMMHVLGQHYEVDTVYLPEEYHLSEKKYSAIIINKPTEPFDEKDKFKIDQYIMRGGKVLWAIDQLNTPVDTLQRTGQFITTEYGLNLDDQLFKYGVRINYNLIEDAQQCNPIPLITGTLSNGQPQIELRPWTFLPFFTPISKHPIVHNMDAIMGRFVNSIDTIANANTTKTILLEASSYSRTPSSPVRVSLSMLRFDPDLRLYNKPQNKSIAAAVLVEGTFNSLYQNRIAPTFLHTLKDSLKIPFKGATDSINSMIVLSDGDFFMNGISERTGPQEMGYWEYTGSLFSNKNFLLNCLEYLTDPNSLLEARSKDLRLRLLDPKRAQDERTKWQFVNVGVPIALILVFASAYMFFRKRKYETPLQKK